VSNRDSLIVDAHGLRAFGASLQHNLDSDLAPSGDQITASFRRGVCFGEGTDSAAVQRAAWAYHAQLEKSVALMENFVHNAAVMIEAVSEMANAYEDADLTSGVDVRMVLDRAVAKINEPAKQEARFTQEFGLR
jgi:hypothetical protein